MPQLNEITVGFAIHGRGYLHENTVATLLSGSCSGWKAVRLGENAEFGEKAMDALQKHFATLGNAGIE